MMILVAITTRIEPWLVKSGCTKSSRRASRIAVSEISSECPVCKAPRLESDVEYVACLPSHSFDISDPAKPDLPSLPLYRHGLRDFQLCVLKGPSSNQFLRPAFDD